MPMAGKKMELCHVKADYCTLNWGFFLSLFHSGLFVPEIQQPKWPLDRCATQNSSRECLAISHLHHAAQPCLNDH